MNQLFAEIARIVGLAICLQLYGLVHTLAANYATDENKKVVTYAWQNKQGAKGKGEVTKRYRY